jgi:hypothetical protein
MAVDGAVRLCQNNFLAASYATVTFSSGVTGSLGANALLPERHKRWIPAGAFEVTSSNNTIYINDGSNKTVTLTAATYTTGASLASHIQTQLNASSSLWTCTYSSTTFKFTIGRSSGTRSLRFTQTTNAAWGMLGYTNAVDTDPGTGLTAANVRRHTSEKVTVDFTTAVTPKFFALIGPADDDTYLTSNATVTIRGNITNSFSSPAITISATIESDGSFFKFFDGLTTTYRYWQIEISDRENDEDVISINQLYLGDYVTPATRNFSPGFSAVHEDPALVQASTSGVQYYRVLPKFWRFESLTAEYVSDDDIAELRRAFRELGASVPLFVSLDPLAQVSASVGEFTKYMRFESPAQINHIFSNYYAFNCVFREVIG